MPITPSEIAENLRGYLDETGGTDGPPAGSHQTKIMVRDGHPIARYDKKTGKLPELFFIAQISEGQHERRTVAVTLKWFAPKEKSEYAGGGDRTEEEMASLAGMYRKQTREFFQGLWGKDMSETPVSLPRKDDSVEEVFEVFKDIAGVIGGLEVRCEVSYRVSKSGVPSDFPDLKWVQMTGSNFSLGA